MVGRMSEKLDIRASEAIRRDIRIADGERLADSGGESLCAEKREVCERARRRGHGYVSDTGGDRNNPNAQRVNEGKDKA